VILDPDDRQRLTLVRTTDSRTALARGLAEYLRDQEIVWEGGRLMRFDNVQVAWAEPPTPATFPALVILGPTPATYEAALLTPTLVKADDGTGRYLSQTSELQQTFQVIVWATDPVQRLGLGAMVEEALDPADFMSGLRLELPFYFGARATYEKTAIQYVDSTDDARNRTRTAIFAVTGNVPQYRIDGDRTSMKPRLDLGVEDDSGSSQSDVED
jgi:hypothetical protein